MATDMNSMMRARRKEMADLPPYDGPAEETSEPVDNPKEEAQETGDLTVMAPGEPSSGESYEYEPYPDAEGAWIVYPPGVPCDDTAYRVSMDKPAGDSDFGRMQEAVDRASASKPKPDSSVVSGSDSTDEGAY